MRNRNKLLQPQDGRHDVASGSLPCRATSAAFHRTSQEHMARHQMNFVRDTRDSPEIPPHATYFLIVTVTVLCYSSTPFHIHRLRGRMRRSAGQSFKRFSSLFTFVVCLLAFRLKSAFNASNKTSTPGDPPLRGLGLRQCQICLCPYHQSNPPSQLLKGNLCYRHSTRHASIATSHGPPNVVCISGFRHSGTRTFGCNRITDMEL